MSIQICLRFVKLQSQQGIELCPSAVVLESAGLDMVLHDKASHSYLLVPTQLYLFSNVPVFQ
jgi:hypothetical protein